MEIENNQLKCVDHFHFIPDARSDVDQQIYFSLLRLPWRNLHSEYLCQLLIMMNLNVFSSRL